MRKEGFRLRFEESPDIDQGVIEMFAEKLEIYANIIKSLNHQLSLDVGRIEDENISDTEKETAMEEKKGIFILSLHKEVDDLKEDIKEFEEFLSTIPL